MRRQKLALFVGAVFAAVAAVPALAQKPPLLPEKDIAALAQELSGETAKRNLEGIARFHRQRGSAGFHSAAELVAERARAYGLSDVAILQFPADGKIFYGTQRSRPAWDADFAELWEMTMPAAKMASYDAEPVVLAEDSESADVTTDLVDAGEGTRASDFAGEGVRGNIVLVGAQPGAVQDLAVGKFGAAGIISYAQNQPTAWSGENENLIRWGHLETFSPNKTFAFMVSLKTARILRARLGAGEKILLHATVKAEQHPGNYEVVTGTIPGADANLKQEEIAFSCHLDHQRPGANDNASGCVTILEVARTLQKLIAEGQLARPARTIRFIWPPEIEGTMALLNGKPEFAQRIKAVVHMDMVGGGPATKAAFHVTRGPMSLPSFVHDVAWAFAGFVNEQSYKFAATGQAEYPFIAPEGGKEPLQAQFSAYTMGSDHDVYQDSSFKIPAIYLNDWPDRYIHTNFDTAANIDSTKLKRAAFIGAASAYFLARMNDTNVQAILNLLQVRSLRIAQEIHAKRSALQSPQDCDGGEIQRFELGQVMPLAESIKRLAPDSANLIWARIIRMRDNIDRNGDGICLQTILTGRKPRVYRRKGVKGPLAVFGYDYFSDHATAAGIPLPKLLSYQGLWGGGEEYAYEALNFVDGSRTDFQITSAVSAEYGPVSYPLVAEYLDALEKIGVLEQVK